MTHLSWQEVVLILGCLLLLASFVAYWLHLRELDRDRLSQQWREQQRYDESVRRLDIERNKL